MLVLPQEYLGRQWEGRAEWVVGMRRDLPTRGHQTNNYAEATIRIVKDIILCRTRCFNVVAFIEFFTAAFEQYLRARILSRVTCTSNDKLRKYKYVTQ
jgi:hypothetical protein